MPSINQQLCTVFLYGRWFSHAIQRKHETKWLGCCWFIVFIWSIRSLMNSVIDDLKLCSWYIYRCAQMFCGIPCNLEPLYDMPHVYEYQNFVIISPSLHWPVPSASWTECPMVRSDALRLAIESELADFKQQLIQSRIKLQKLVDDQTASWDGVIT